MSGNLREVMDAARRAKAEPQLTDIEDVSGHPEQQTTTKRAKAAPDATAAKAWRHGGGKSSNPDYERLNVYVRKVTRKQAARKWEDEGHRDLSDLVEQLLIKYLNT